ncbi:MAG: redoxin domain-containing protein [Acidobacteriota bacterium]|nr:redoxin domain-containing protein [Acidobacteriota bacterium]
MTERERLYIEASAAGSLPDLVNDKSGVDASKDASKEASKDRQRNQSKILETLCVKYPDDMEARALLALNTSDSRYGVELMIREILAKQPNHPGAHHYRIHNWDYNEPQQALASAHRYSELVPGIGHALHMPGHIYSILGMWNEAAISMDAATRAEKRYMKDTLTFPFNQWNYAHNRGYPSYIQGQMGMADAEIFGARQLIDAPLAPKGNAEQSNTAHAYGLQALARVLVNYERWDQLLDPKYIPWGDTPADKSRKAYSEARAWLGNGDGNKAEKSMTAHAALKTELKTDLKTELDKLKYLEPAYNLQTTELKARLALLRGDTLQGLGMLADASRSECEMQKRYADPPQYPQSLYNSLGEAYLAAKSPALAVMAYDRALALTHNDIFALSGMVRAHAALGEKAKAEEAMATLLYTASDADRGLKLLEQAKATGIAATPRDRSPEPQRRYARVPLERFGPPRWKPYAAPALDVLDTTGKKVSLDEYRGKNVLLVYYLGEECPHCMKQLHEIGAKKDELARLQTVVLAVSSAAPEKNATGMKQFGDLPVRLLSDNNHVNARRFHSYDDFEDMEVHSTMLIDRKGRLYWANFGGDPFKDTAFLISQIERMNEFVKGEELQAAVPIAANLP